MHRSSPGRFRKALPFVVRTVAASLLFLLAVPSLSWGQTSTASLRGYILGAGREPIADAQIELRDVASGTRRGSRSNASGFYNVSAVPPSTYAVRITRLGFAPRTDTLILTVGAVVTRDYVMSQAATQLGAVQVSAARAVEDVRSTEVGTVITPEQIQNLPQVNRNFLNFATLAPGVQQHDAGISAGGASAMNSNVFIDGASYKDDVLPGGVVGQDPSIAQNLRGVGQVVGNPFPQNAVQEFRVITQNYKAEYQKASGAVITAATKSGTNQVQGDLFFEGTNQNAFARSYYDLRDTAFRKPRYHKAQFGGSVGGPIIRDKAHYFLSYEGNYQFLERQVIFRPPVGAPALPESLLAGQGNYGTPLHSNLGFGKVDYALSDRQSLVFSANVRSDYDNRDFGGGTAETGADRIDNNVQELLLKHTYAGQSYTNEAQINFGRFQWKVAPHDLTDPQRIYESWGVTRGGGISPQNFVQGRLSLRNDLTRTAAAHVIKGGVNVDFLDYNINKALNENPTFRYNAGQPGSDTVPYSASLQVGNPDLKAHNWQMGLYLQDDWTATPRLTLYYGLRWDYESEWLNNSFVTPQWVRDSVAAFTAQFPFFSPANYISNGRSSRPNYYKAFQPRGGFSYDVTGQNRTVVFGGGGLFYDRTIYNILLDEKYKAQRPSYNFQFRPASDTLTADQSKLVWQSSYLSRAGLLQLINSGQYNKPEVFLVDNNQKPPYSTQANLGVRQALGQSYELSVTGTIQNNYNQFKWMWGHRDPVSGNLQWGAHGMSDILLSTDAGKSRYRALLFSLRKPMVGNARWGGDLNYTLAKSEANTYNDVEDPFALDAAYIRPSSLFMIPSRFDERHRVVMNLMGRVPFGILLSTVTTLGSGVPYTLDTGCQGPWDFTDPNGFCAKSGFTPVTQFVDGWNGNPNGKGPRSERAPGKWFGPFGKWAYRNVDLRLEKDVGTTRGQRVALMLDVFNLFNFTNFNYDNFEYNLRWDTNQGAGPVRERIPFSTFNPRSAQLGMRYTF